MARRLTPDIRMSSIESMADDRTAMEPLMTPTINLSTDRTMAVDIDSFAANSFFFED
jgi:hypothetical protein